jgi:hypothetical protein
MGMAQACTCVQKMEIRHIFITAPIRLATCLHVQKTGQEDSRLLAGLAHLHMVPPISLIPPPIPCRRGQRRFRPRAFHSDMQNQPHFDSPVIGKAGAVDAGAASEARVPSAWIT